MVQRVLIPLLLLAGFFFIATSVDRVKGYNFPVSTFCRISPQGPAADVLFIGSSRIRASFDPVFMEEHARALTGEPLRVHMLSSSSTDLILYNALSRKYLRERGNPAHVFIEAMHTTRTNIDFYREHKDRPLVPYVSNVGRAFLPLADYAAILATPPFDQPLQRLRPQQVNIVELAASQYVAAFYRFLEAPRESLHDRSSECRQLTAGGDAREAHYQQQISDWQAQSPQLVDDALRATPAFAGTIGNVAPRAPDSPARKYENAAMHALIKRFRDAGVENIHVVVLSSFEEPAISDRDRQAYEQLFPGTDIIFSEDLYKDTPELALMYLDRFHYNASGTQVLTRAYLDRVLGDD
ncbi:MAG: hypothetical protein P1U64_02035 [Alcanivoracaceae bacterium]|jgi:hypothetical protein|nr:hypothetical protein [Alcanivoracaceae bacterium]